MTAVPLGSKGKSQAQTSERFHPIKSLKIRWLIRKWLKSKDVNVRRSTAETLERLGVLTTELKVKWCIEDLQESGYGKITEWKRSQIRQSAVEALGKIGCEAEEAVPALIEALKSGNVSLRCDIIQTLGEIGSAAKAAIPALIEIVYSEHFDECEYAAEALKNIGALTTDLKIESSVKAMHLSSCQHPVDNLAKIGKPAVPALIVALKDQAKVVRRRAAEALGKIGTEAKAAIPALIAALDDEGYLVRESAADALEKIGALTSELNIKRHVKNIIIREHRGDDEVVGTDFPWVLPEVNKPAQEYLIKTGRPAVPLLIKVIEDNTNFYALIAAVDTLAKMGPEAKIAIPTLIKVLEDKDTKVREAAQEAIRKIESA